MKKRIWDLFKLTGDVKYYIMYKEMEREEFYESKESERTSN